MIDVMIRAFSRARFRQFAVAQGLIRQEEDRWLLNDGVAIEEIGNAVITPGVYETGTFPPVEITAPVIDMWWLVNLRMVGQRATDDEDELYPGEVDSPWRFLRSKFVRNARENATVVTTPWGGRAFQFGAGDQRIQLLDPREEGHAPKREWLGGMSL